MPRALERIPGNPWLRSLTRGSETATTVCFPHAGGSAGYYRPLARSLPSATTVLAVQYPGRRDRWREPAIPSIELLADHVARALEGHQRVTLFGHSMGALVAFEVAHRLPVQALIVSSAPAPTRVVDNGVHRRDDTALVAEVRSLGGAASAALADPDVLSLTLPALRGDYRAVETYRPKPRATVDCDVIALTGDADPRVAQTDVGAWRDHTSGRFDLHVYAGGHFYLDDHVSSVASRIVEAARPQPAPAA